MASSFARLASRGCRNRLWRLQFPSLIHHGPAPQTRGLFHTTRAVRQVQNSSAPRLIFAATAIGIGLSTNIPHIHCDAPTPEEAYILDKQVPKDLPPPPQSSVSLYQLSFGTVSGICAGIFIKKGAKATAWLLGGIFVLLQYLSSTSVVRVDWGRVATRFENAFHTRDVNGISQPPTIIGLWGWLVNFLTADFQPRASFVAGLVLGLRIG